MEKVPIIPPLLVDNKIISNIEAKANYFNNFFASQCTPLNNNNKIPENQTYTTYTKNFLIKLEDKDITNIIRSLNVYKAHGHDNVSIRILKICDTAIVQPLSTIFNNCIKQKYVP